MSASSEPIARAPRIRFNAALGLLILLIAAFARIYAFGDSPPGLQHDEIFKAMEGRALIERGDFRIFYPSNQGHEGGYVWVLGAAYLLFGASVMMIKFPPLAFGMLTVALTYRVMGELAGRRVGAVAAGLCAVSIWAVFTSRVGLRAVLLPVVVLLVIGGLGHLARVGRRAPRPLPFISAVGIATAAALGLAVYTYTSAFALHIGFGAYILALAIFDRPLFRRLWRPLALIALMTLVSALPMLDARLNDPQGTNRVSTITRPLNDLLAGQPRELLDNATKLAGMFAFTGDPEARYNLPGRPLFVLPVGLLVYAGLALMIGRARREPLYAALLALLLAGLIPSLLTVSAPSFLRSIPALPVVMLAVALATDAIARALRDHRLAGALGAGVVLVTAVADWPAYFDRWPRDEAVQMIYRDDLEALAHDLHRADPAGLTLVSTTDPALDAALFAFYGSPAGHVAFFDGRTTLALPAPEGQRPATLYISPWSAITPPHAPWLTPEFGAAPLRPLVRQDGEVAFARYTWDARDSLAAHIAANRPPLYIATPPYPRGDPADWGAPLAYPVRFGDALELVALELPRTRIATEFDGVNIQLYFRPLRDDLDAPLSIFVHMARRDGRVHAQRDLLGVPTTGWSPAMLFIQDNFVIAGPTPPGPYWITLGVYDVSTGERLPILDADGAPLGDQVLVGRVRAVE
jgi:4-amino-4-deoxy-L-arabinose transferase-like glycosyltransferase